MTPRASLLQLAKLVSKDIEAGHPGTVMRHLGSALSDSPDGLLGLLDLLVAETGKKRPSGRLIAALLLMLRETLNEARMRAEARRSGEPPVIQQLRSRLTAAAAAGQLAPELLMSIAREFAAARLDIGDDLRSTMLTLSEAAMGEGGADIDPGELDAHIRGLASALDNDPFLVHAQLSESLSVYPEEQRIVIVRSLVTSDVPAMREASLGWLLDPSENLAQAVAQQLVEGTARNLVSAASAARLLLMRNWVAESVRALVDAAGRACRQRGLIAAAEGPIQVAFVIASGCDGAGAQSFFVATKRGRKLALASLLVKHEFGIGDAFVQNDMSKRDVDGMVDDIMRELDPFDASLDIVEASIANGLAVGLERSSPPPFGLVQFVEAIGLGAIAPARKPGDRLVAELVDALPAERKSATAVAAALKQSKHWPEEYGCMDSWFEDVDQTIPGLAAAKTKKQRQDLVIDRILAGRRSRWASLLAWTAAAARDEVDGEDWIDLALVAREMLGDRPLKDIPIVRRIAETTVQAMRAG